MTFDPNSDLERRLTSLRNQQVGTADLLDGAVTSAKILDGTITVADLVSTIFPLGVGAWPDFTPTLTQSGAVTKTLTYSKLQRVGRLVVANILLTVTGTGTASNQIIVGLPVVPAQAAMAAPIGTFYVRDDSTGLFYLVGAVINAAGALIGIGNGVNNALGVTGFTAALANLDTVGYSVAYEAAS